ncbi:universal stress protein [Xenorhabdus bovienii]|uniref:Uncharacterized protein n=1 Tax=Xenorhabdus bovienii str. feltiae Moldova TaxID=1398200 RepID=A0A077NID1_XENBV|nr:universal stress protein [Xenorhabdus bovienii]CDH01947.1 conserved hypothetical protein [Xenorhabdus bovienii str. feltiae Moldova]
MSKKETKTKRILYKEVKITGQTRTLQDLLSDIISEHPKAESRKELINPSDENLFRLINRHEVFQGMLFCQLVAFEPGNSQRYIQLKNNAESYEIRSVTSTELAKLAEEDTDEAKQEREEIIREFIDSILYFGVYGDSVIIMQSRSLTTRELETHLRWLLGSLTSKIPNGNVLVIRDKPKEEILEKVMKKPVKSVTIGTPIEASNQTGKDGVNQWVPSGTGAEILKAALSEKWDNFIKGIKLTDCLDDANLEVRLVFSFKRKTSENGEKVLRNIVDATRHYPDEDVTIEMVGGTKLSGQEIRLWNTVNLVTYNSLIDEHDLYGQMHEWLTALLTSGEIESHETT